MGINPHLGIPNSWTSSNPSKFNGGRAGHVSHPPTHATNNGYRSNFKKFLCAIGRVALPRSRGMFSDLHTRPTLRIVVISKSSLGERASHSPERSRIVIGFPHSPAIGDRNNFKKPLYASGRSTLPSSRGMVWDFRTRPKLGVAVI